MRFVDASQLRKGLLYLGCLVAAALAVFLATYLLGRHPSLEAELERLNGPRSAPDAGAGKSRGIPSLQQVEAPAEAPAPPPEPGGQPLGAGITVSRSALEPGGMVVIADLPALAGLSSEPATPLLGGLTAFLSRSAGALRVGVRALAGAHGDCAAPAAVSAIGQGGAAVPALEAAAGSGPGPRNPARAVEAAAADLAALPGERCVVIVTGGEEGCGADLCGAAPPPGGQGLRIHVVLLAPRPQPGGDAALPDAGSGGALPPVFDPPWAAPYRCLAERSGGSMASVSTPADLEGALRRIAGSLEAAVVVRGFHFNGQEIKGVSPGGAGGWGAALATGPGAAGGARDFESEALPAAFAVPQGVYVLKTRFAGQERTAAVAVGAGERAEVRVTFTSGVLFLQALDAAGGEIVGDSAGFSCAWGADVFPAGDEEAPAVASTCSFPARLELAPGTYRVRTRWKGLERVIEEVAVEAGASSLNTVSFGKDGE